jgi:predicted dehydrogenase
MISSVIIGCGRIGCGFDDDISQNKKRTHASGYTIFNETTLTAFSDIDPLKLKKYGKKFSVDNLYEDYNQMFDDLDIDVVSICTLSDSHLELVKKAASSGVKGIFIEKPISDSLENAKKIIKICEENKITLLVDHQRRFESFYHEMKKIITSEKLGQIQSVHVYYGAGITNTGSHIFDLLRYFFGEITSVLSKKSKSISPNPLDPNLDVVLEFSQNFNGHLHALDISNYGICEFDIFGANGRLKVDLLTNQANYFQVNSNSHDYKILSLEKSFIDSSKKSGTILGIENLISCINSNDIPLCNGYDGYKSLELISASIMSASKKTVINLPLETNSYKINSK